MPPPLTAQFCFTSRRLGTILTSGRPKLPPRTPLIPPAAARLLTITSRFPCCSAVDRSSSSGDGARPPPAEYLRAQRDKMRQKVRERIADVKDNILTIPNALCIARISVTPVIGYLVVIEWFMPACALFTVAGISDMLDGWIARSYPSQKSMLGSILDPVADKFLISTLFVTLTYAHLIPLALTSVVLLRDVLLILGGFVRRYQLLEPPFTLRRYFDPSISSIRIVPTVVSKANTVLQLLLVTLSLASPVFGYENHPILSLLCVCTGLTTIYSGAQYATGKAMIPAKKIIEQRKMSS